MKLRIAALSLVIVTVAVAIYLSQASSEAATSTQKSLGVTVTQTGAGSETAPTQVASPESAPTTTGNSASSSVEGALHNLMNGDVGQLEFTSSSVESQVVQFAATYAPDLQSVTIVPTVTVSNIDQTTGSTNLQFSWTTYVDRSSLADFP